jgi:hypothetical protein
MAEFIPDNTYSFNVIGVREENETKYIYLSDGFKDSYRVKPYDFQLEWEDYNLPAKLSCYVKSVSIWGMPLLHQDKNDVLEHCYSEINSEYAFKLLAVRVDEKTQATYYELKDAFGIKHRHYPNENEPKHQIGDIFSLFFSGIDIRENNASRLLLKYPKDLIVLPDNSVNPESVINNPHEESKFGVENEIKEFKSTIVFPAGGIVADIDKQIGIILKTIAGFQNSKGGELYLGVNDSGNICGINHDYQYLNSSTNDIFTYQKNNDGYENKIRNAVKRTMGSTANSNLTLNFFNENNLDYCIIKINEVFKPIFSNDNKLFQRAGNMTQLLKGDEITWFVLDRLRSGNAGLILPELVTELTEKEEDIDNNYTDHQPTVRLKTDKDEEIIIPEIQQNHSESKVWYYMTFYENGDWSFNKTPEASEDLIYQLPIPTSLKKERLLMIYDNGCVNVVVPFDIINPKGVNDERKLKTIGKRYKNGWNTNATLLKINCSPANHLIVFNSKHNDGSEYIKIHNVNAISIHTTLYLEGNVIVNPRLDAKLTDTTVLPLEYYHLISGLILKDHQTSNYLGIKTTNKNYQKAIYTLKKVIENIQQLGTVSKLELCMEILN